MIEVTLMGVYNEEEQKLFPLSPLKLIKNIQIISNV